MSEPERTISELERRLRAAGNRAAPARAAAAAARRTAARAAAPGGGADVVYAEVESPLGPLLAAAGGRGLVRLAYLAETTPETVLEGLAERLSPRIVEAPGRLEDLRRELDQYFAGSRREFDLALDLSLARGFGARVLGAARRIPYGGVRTYREVAAAAGNRAATRAAGNALGANPLPIVVPCHRVVRTGGGLGGYTGGLHRKRFLLALEGGPSR